MRTFTFLAVWLAMLAAAFAGGYFAYTQVNKPVPVQGPLDILPRPRPRPPKPDPGPAPAPLEESDSKLFQRLRLHIEKAADERAKRHVEAFSAELGDKLDKMNEDGTLIVSDGEPSQFIGTSFLVGAIFTVVKKIVIYVVKLILVAAIVGLLWMYWPWLVGGFVAGVTVVCWPIAFSAAKLANNSLTKEEVEAIVQLRLAQPKPKE